MAIINSFVLPSSSFNYDTQSCGCGPPTCPSDCPPGIIPDFTIRRHDTKPAFKVSVSDCNGPIDLTGLVLEVNMWAKAKLKANVQITDTYFRLANDVGFNQAMVGDIIIMDRTRLPEQMLVTGFDETNMLIQVQRGYHGTTPSFWKKGTGLKIFRILNAPAVTEMILEDKEELDGHKEKDHLADSLLVYEWQPNDVCLPGCYWLEFKLLKMLDLVLFLPGRHWCGPTNIQSGGYYFTGSLPSDSSVVLSYDSAKNLFNLTNEVWNGPYHLEGSIYYTGTLHDDGSVPLSKTGIPEKEDFCYSASGSVILVRPHRRWERDHWEWWNRDHWEWDESINNLQWDNLRAILPLQSSWDSSISCISAISITPSFTEGLTPTDYGCVLGEGVESVRRFPCDREAFLVQILDSPNTEF